MAFKHRRNVIAVEPKLFVATFFSITRATPNGGPFRGQFALQHQLSGAFLPNCTTAGPMENGITVIHFLLKAEIARQRIRSPH
jgi:hypothetical protein